MKSFTLSLRLFPRGASRAARVLAIFLLTLALPAALAAQDLAAWFAKPANQAAYGAIATEANSLAAAVRAASLSDSLLAARLEEAAKKRVPPTLLLATLRADTERYLFIADTLRRRSLLPADAQKASALVEQLALVMRSGIVAGELDASLDAAVAKLGAKASNNAAVARAVAALSVLALAKAEYGLSESDSYYLAIALTGSDLSNAKLNSVLKSIAALVAQGNSTSDALETVLAKVTKGNSAEAKAQAAEKSNEGKSGENGKSGNSEEKEGKGNSGESGKGGKKGSGN